VVGSAESQPSWDKKKGDHQPAAVPSSAGRKSWRRPPPVIGRGQGFVFRTGPKMGASPPPGQRARANVHCHRQHLACSSGNVGRPGGRDAADPAANSNVQASAFEWGVRDRKAAAPSGECKKPWKNPAGRSAQSGAAAMTYPRLDPRRPRPEPSTACSCLGGNLWGANRRFRAGRGQALGPHRTRIFYSRHQSPTRDISTAWRRRNQPLVLPGVQPLRKHQTHPAPDD